MNTRSLLSSKMPPSSTCRVWKIQGGLSTSLGLVLSYILLCWADLQLTITAWVSSKIKSWPIRHLNNYFPPGSYFPLSLISESLRLNSLSQNGPRKGHDSNFNATKSVLCIFLDVNIFFSAYRKCWRVPFCYRSFSMVCQRICL